VPTCRKEESGGHHDAAEQAAGIVECVHGMTGYHPGSAFSRNSRKLTGNHEKHEDHENQNKKSLFLLCRHQLTDD
jgi:hypothetical protein